MPKAPLKPTGRDPKNTELYDPENYNSQAANTADPDFELPRNPGVFQANSKRVTSTLDHLEKGSNSKQRM